MASEVVFVKMPSHQQERRAKQREEYIQNRDDELESFRVRYNADPEQKRASVRDSYRADLESNRASKRQRYEQNSDEVRGGRDCISARSSIKEATL